MLLGILVLLSVFSQIIVQSFSVTHSGGTPMQDVGDDTALIHNRDEIGHHASVTRKLQMTHFGEMTHILQNDKDYKNKTITCFIKTTLHNMHVPSVGLSCLLLLPRCYTPYAAIRIIYILALGFFWNILGAQNY